MKFTTLLQHITPHRRTLLWIVVLLLANSAAALLQPWLAGELTGVVIGRPDKWILSVQLILLAWLGLAVARGLLAFASGYLGGSTGELMSAKLRTRVYEHLQALPLAYYHERRSGETLSLLSNDAQVISRFITSTLVSMLPLVLTFLGAFAIMAWLDPLIAGLAVLLMPVYYIAMKLIGRRIRPISRDWINAWSNTISFVEENIGLLPAIKAFIREPVESERFGAANTELLTSSRKQVLVQSILSPVIGLLASGGLLLLLWVGIRHVESGQLDTPGLVSLLLYAMLLTRPIAGLADVYGQIQRTRGAAERLLGFFSEQPEPFDENKPAISAVRGSIEFRNVSFTYPGREPVLQDFSLHIDAGETVALTGPNGAGKTTLVHLLMRFMDPDAGCILVDDTDISVVSLASLRQQIGLVAQNTLLLNGTVAENIAYGHHMAQGEDIKLAAKAARADEFIAHLPDGLDTIIGDQGIKLSGGQRQRLSLARTLLKDPPILVLDEATAMFDPAGELSFIEESKDLLEERTVILITHRPASLALADRILKMDGGKLTP